MENNLLLISRPTDILLNLRNHSSRDNNLTKISRDIGISNNLMFNLINELESLDLIKTYKIGRDRKVSITKNGIKVADNINTIIKVLKLK